MPNTQTASAADVRQQKLNSTFARMRRSIARVAKDTKAEDVHQFRTNSRRIEVLVGQLSSESRNSRKLLKRLSKLRKKAGKLRDLDVEIAFLKELKVPDRRNQRLHLLGVLTEEHALRSKKLVKAFKAEKSSELRKRLSRAASEIHLSALDPLRLAYDRLPKLTSSPLTEKTLHACRISGRRARYLAELAPDSPEARRFVEELKTAQDSIGKWHDVMKLSERAENLFGGVSDSPLVSALRNIARARFRRASAALQSSLKRISDLRKPASSAEKVPVQPARYRAAAA